MVWLSGLHHYYDQKAKSAKKSDILGQKKSLAAWLQGREVAIVETSRQKSEFIAFI